MPIKETHPNLYRAYLANGFVNILIGLFGLFNTLLTPISYAFIAIFIGLGLSIIFFTVRYNPTAVRISLISSLFYNSFFVFLFLLFLGLEFKDTRDTAYVIPLFMGHALATYIISIEPPTNPVTMIREEEE